MERDKLSGGEEGVGGRGEGWAQTGSMRQSTNLCQLGSDNALFAIIPKCLAKMCIFDLSNAIVSFF